MVNSLLDVWFNLPRICSVPWLNRLAAEHTTKSPNIGLRFDFAGIATALQF
jgi:hypothetical protein